MTTPEERTRAVVQTRAFLQELQHLDVSGADAMQWVRTEAGQLLRHYPFPEDTERAAQSLKLWDMCAAIGLNVEEAIGLVAGYYKVLEAANQKKRAKPTAKAKGARTQGSIKASR